MKRFMTVCMLSAALVSGSVAWAQEQAGDAEMKKAAENSEVQLEKTDAAKPASNNSGFWGVVTGSGWLGFVLWMALFGCGAAAVYFIVDSWVMIKPAKIMPPALINSVKDAMDEGDPLKALEVCSREPGPMANILSAGFTHVEEGFDVIQEAIGAAADLETERIMQQLNWISVCANLAPMLGLLGTVQGMILCFATLASGAPDIGALASNISQALWTTAGGLVVAIPAVAFFYALRNNANRLVLRMQAMTMELIKGLRNVEVVQE